MNKQNTVLKMYYIYVIYSHKLINYVASQCINFHTGTRIFVYVVIYISLLFKNLFA